MFLDGYLGCVNGASEMIQENKHIYQNAELSYQCAFNNEDRQSLVEGEEQQRVQYQKRARFGAVSFTLRMSFA